MFSVPELGHDAKILALDDAAFNALVNGLIDFFCVLVETCAVEESVSAFNSELDGIGDLVVVMERVEPYQIQWKEMWTFPEIKRSDYSVMRLFGFLPRWSSIMDSFHIIVEGILFVRVSLSLWSFVCFVSI
jgi:hypothetical protein